jgi:Raf kinase inhibitor-like YbhB/YbcL family protein
MRTLSIITSAAFGLGFLLLANFASAQNFTVTSQTFKDNQNPLPQSMIFTRGGNGTNECTANGMDGGNKSPQLTWTNIPPGTVSFVVVMYDRTAAFTHWGMYNIAGDQTGLPEGEGVPGSTRGKQISQSLGPGSEYSGPCPPKDLEPVVHTYVVTVYALSIMLDLASSANFPATSDTLYRALFRAAGNGHVLATAQIIGLYSSKP